MGGPAFFHSPSRVTVKPSNYKSKDSNESPALLCKPVAQLLGCDAGGREFDSGRTNTQGLKITE